MIKKINHIGIAVKNLDDAVKQYQKLGFTVDRIEDMPELKCRMAFLPVGEALLELIEPMGEGAATQYLETHGEGIHHICYEVDDIDEAFATIGAALPIRDPAPTIGAGNSRVFFMRPENLCNVETEFVEMPKEDNE